MNALGYCCDSLRSTREIAKYRAFIGHIGGMDDMLFQHDDTCSSLCTCSVVICMQPAEQVVTREVGGMAAKYNAVARLAWPYHKGLKDPHPFVLQQPHTNPFSCKT